MLRLARRCIVTAMAAASSADLTDEAIEAQLRIRAAARGRRDFACADRIRIDLLDAGVAVVDAPECAKASASLESAARSAAQLASWIRFPPMVPSIAGCRKWSRRRFAFCAGSTVDRGGHYCVVHAAEMGGRVPCPFDNKHAVTLPRLCSHLFVCQSRPGVRAMGIGEGGDGDGAGAAQPHLAKGINAADEWSSDDGGDDDGGDDAAAEGERCHPLLFDAALVDDAAAVAAAAVQLPLLEALRTRVETALLSLGPRVAAVEADAEGRSRVALVPLPLEARRPRGAAAGLAMASTSASRKVANAKHDVEQQASILAHMLRSGVLRTRSSRGGEEALRATTTVAVELCAGKGKLSKLLRAVWAEEHAAEAEVAASSSPVPPLRLVLVDRTVNRKMAFTSLDSGTGGKASSWTIAAARGSSSATTAPPERLLADVADLVLLKAPSLRALTAAASDGGGDTNKVRFAAMGKHLCGSACDLALRCCVRAAASCAAPSLQPSPACRAAALCEEAAAILRGGGGCDCGAPGCGTSDFGPESVAALERFFAQLETTEEDAAGAGTGAKTEAEKVKANTTRGVGLEWGGAAFATCCHHFCDWSTFVDTRFLAAFGIRAGEFALMRRTTTRYRVRVAGGSRGAAAARSDGARLAATQAELGILSKRLIDEVRARWLRRRLATLGRRGATVRLLRYCIDEVSPESTLLLWSDGTSAAAMVPAVVAV